ncbi:MAG: hypothetical protein IJR28_02995 [Ottowia sp.]|nr:hypothetical protein [Ottowia sp.]
MKSVTQEMQVIRALRREGGCATFRRLNEILDFSTWKTKTPQASVRRIVQLSKYTFKIQPGLWALEEMREEVLRRLSIKQGDRRSEEQFSHSYYQGLLVEIGKQRNRTTYIPAQDKSRAYPGTGSLGDIADTVDIPRFTYNELLRRAKTVDVIWFNERMMPSDFYEVEHTTDIKNSLTKFYELQDFYAGFYIVADASRRKEFEDKVSASIFSAIKGRVKFLDYDKVSNLHAGMLQVSSSAWGG